ncbi:MAG: hypothetical protein P1U86_18655 [Verrucomicrobiales bacterium]|nr:hypothetical protein [Verrucomicrobiales bacterium]
MMATESPESLFSRVIDRESLYDAGTYILGLEDSGLTESQQDFKRCYDLWLGLGNGFYAVCNGTYLSSLPRGVAAFDRIGTTVIATPGRLVLAEFKRRDLPITEEEISFFVPDDSELDRFHRAVQKIDEEYVDQIWDAADTIEQRLITLASGRPQRTSTEQAGGGQAATRAEST